MAAINKREVRGCIEHVISMREYMLDVMQIRPELREYIEPMIRKDLNSLATRLDYIESIADTP